VTTRLSKPVLNARFSRCLGASAAGANDNSTLWVTPTRAAGDAAVISDDERHPDAFTLGASATLRIRRSDRHRPVPSRSQATPGHQSRGAENGRPVKIEEMIIAG
jgi:hypothetical protein